MTVDNHIFLKNRSDLFSHEPLERGDHVEAVREIRVSAQAILALEAPVDVAMARTDLPDEQSLTLVIPGQPAGLSPESITTGRSCWRDLRHHVQTTSACGYGFRARAPRAPE